MAALAIQSGWLWSGNVPAPELPELYRAAIVTERVPERIGGNWLWPGNVPANVAPDLFGAQFSQGTGAAARLSPRSSVTHGGVPPASSAAVSIPPFTPLIVSQAVIYRDRHWLRSGNEPAAEKPELYRRIIVGSQLHERPNARWLWSGNLPAPEQPELYRGSIVGRQLYETPNARWLWPGNVPANVAGSPDLFGVQFSQGTAATVNAVIRPSIVHSGVPPTLTAVPPFSPLLVRQIVEHRNRSLLLAGNQPAPEQPELYRVAVVADSQPHRDSYQSGFRWPGNAPLSEQPELYRAAIVQDQFQHRDNAKPAVLRAGNQPVAEQPELYRLIVIGQQQPDTGRAWTFSGFVSPPVTPPNPKFDGAVLRQQIPERPNESRLLAGNNPAAEQPELYRRILVGSQLNERPNARWLWPGNIPANAGSPDLFGVQFAQGNAARVNASIRASVLQSGVPPASAAVPPFRPLIVRQAFDYQDRSFLFAGNQSSLPPGGLSLGRGSESNQRGQRRHNSFLWPGNLPAVEQPELYRSIVVVQRIPERPNASRLWPGNNPIAEQPELYRSAIVLPPAIPDVNRSWFRHFVPPDVFGPAPKYDAVINRQQLDERPNPSRVRPGNQPAPEQPELYRLIIVGQQQPDTGRAWTFSGFVSPPATPPAPKFDGIVLRQQVPERPNESSLLAGNNPAAEQPELYRLAISPAPAIPDVSRCWFRHFVPQDVFGPAPKFDGAVIGQQFHQRPNETWLRSGNRPAPEQSELYQRAIIPAPAIPDVSRSWFRHFIPTDAPKFDAVITRQQLDERPNPSRLWNGNQPGSEQPELYRIVVAADNQQHRDNYRSGFRWPGNAPLAEQAELYRSAIVPDQFQHRDNAKPPVLRAGNQPAPEQPELYRSAIVRQQFHERVNPTVLRSGVAPLAERPEVYRLITVREWQPDKGRAWLQWAIPSARFKFLKVSIEVRARLDGDADMTGRINTADHSIRPGTRGTGEIDHQ